MEILHADVEGLSTGAGWETDQTHRHVVTAAGTTLGAAVSCLKVQDTI